MAGIQETRIELNMSPTDMLLVMAEGNPGAISALTIICAASPRIDPQAMLGAYTPLFTLDMLNIYGPRIWMLFKDVCRQSAETTLAVLRAFQLGLLSRNDLNRAIDDCAALDVADLVAKVKSELSDFGAVAAVTQPDQAA